MAERVYTAALLALASLTGCAGARVAEPRAQVERYADAARRGDAAAIYAMLSERSRRELGWEGTKRLVRDNQRELAAQADALNQPNVPLEALAVVRYEDGEQATLELENGVFKIGSAAALPAAPRTPAQALGDLRRALAMRSYAAFLRVLTAETRSNMESDLSALVRGLEDPETLDIEVRGDTAELVLPGGHSVKLKRERGIWLVEDLR